MGSLTARRPSITLPPDIVAARSDPPRPPPAPGAGEPRSPRLDARVRDTIRTWLAASGITQVELAQRIGRTQAWVSRYLKGQIEIDADTADQIAQALGQSIQALIETALDLPRYTDPQEAQLLKLFRELPPDVRRSILTLLETQVQAQRRARRTR